MDKRLLTVEETCADRLDVYLSKALSITRSYVKQLIDKGLITVGGEKVKSGSKLKKGDEISVAMPEEVTGLIPEDIPIDIVYEDGDIAVINKPQGLTVHPGGGANTGTLANALLYRLKELSTINGTVRPGIVHRLDKDTSGVMVIAKNDAAHLSLSRQIADRTVEKIYLALCEGTFGTDDGEIITKIGRSPKNRKLMAVTDDGREAVTRYKVIEKFSGYTLVEFKILTGRTHQIRVHAKYLSHPIVGDKSYGAKKQSYNLSGQLLHAYQLSFDHPASGERMTFTAPLPEHFERVLRSLGSRKTDGI